MTQSEICLFIDLALVLVCFIGFAFLASWLLSQIASVFECLVKGISYVLRYWFR